jgi:uncharacterized phage protein (TIGR01671 family)
MRTIKFRGKTSDGEWLYGDLTTALGWSAEPSIIEENSHNEHVTPESVGQFIGLTDKDGREIYEGDIITIGGKYPKLIRYLDEFAGFCLANTEDLKICWKNIWQPITPVWWDEFKREMLIIGNEHDNPEML